MVDPNFDVEGILRRLTVLEKVTLLAGKNGFRTSGAEKQGVPSLRLGDGPQGPRGVTVHNGPSANCFPSEIALGASFDRDLVKEIASHLATECKAKKLPVLLGPNLNLSRGPLCGRGFETFGEDPHLAGEPGAVFVSALQRGAIGACVKHFVGNEQEYEKHKSDSIISPRALREVYLEPFRIAIQKADPWTLMPAYNMIAGVHCSENVWLLQDVLRKEWGYKGTIVSDWYGVHDPVGSVKAGCDIEMPGKPFYRTNQVMTDLLGCGKLSESDLDECVRRVLQLVKRTMGSGIDFESDEEEIVDTSYTRDLLRRRAASGVVLLKNESGLLPISSRHRRVAVIGPCAAVALTSGGGAAGTPNETFRCTPLQALEAKCAGLDIPVQYSPGAFTHQYAPLIDPYMRHPENHEHGRAKIEFWSQSPSKLWKSSDPRLESTPAPDYVFSAKSLKCFMHDGIPQNIIDTCHHVRVSFEFVPPSDGDWNIGLTSGDHAQVFSEGRHIIDYDQHLEPGDLFFNYCYKEKIATLKNLVKGQPCRLEFRFWDTDHHHTFPVAMATGFQIGAYPALDEGSAISAAVELAKSSDITILVVGLGKDFETEGMDRSSMDLPGASNRLVSEILSATSNVVVVTQSALPISMPWVQDCHTLVHQFYGGSNVGAGLADVLFGDVNPSGKMPLTFPVKLYDSPSSLGYGIDAPSFGKAYYQEDIYIGYRHFDRASLAPLFPFGFGLSYTTFELSNLAITPLKQPAEFEVKLNIANTGGCAGQEVIQVYVQHIEPGVSRPVKELKGFAKVELEVGDEKKVSITLDKHAFQYWDSRDRHQWVAAVGKYVILVGTSSVHLPLSAEVDLVDSLYWTGL